MRSGDTSPRSQTSQKEREREEGADPQPRQLSNHCLCWFLRRILGKPLAFLRKPPQVKICYILSHSLGEEIVLAGRYKAA